jgi:hypothetical protein
MNYFAHALPFLDRPYFAAGTGVPDWLMVCDRQARLQLKRALPFVDDLDPRAAEVARGVVQHLRDDRQFHATRAFAETTLELAAQIRGVLDDASSLPAGFLAHLLVELLLDAALIEARPDRLHAYYQVLDAVDSQVVQDAVNRMASQPAERLASFIALYRESRILWDYLEDERLMMRMNQVMRRLELPQLPSGFPDLLPAARELVRAKRPALLDGVPVV